MRPNYLIENKLTLKTPLIKVQNKVFKTKERNLTEINEEFSVDQIEITLKQLSVSGYFSDKILMETPCLKIVFTSFLFFRELKVLRGLDFLLKNLHFGSDIEVYSNEMIFNLFKEDFFYFMTILYNNILFTDYLD